MIHLTEKAEARIRQLMQEQGAEEGQALRLFVEKGGCSGFEYGMRMDRPQDGDARVGEGSVAMIVDPESMAQLSGSTVDFDDGLQGKGFEIRNPNATNTCGCGRSFS